MDTKIPTKIKWYTTNTRLSTDEQT